MSDLKAYAGVTAAYWGFTLTDGALRMLVLLHFHRLGFTPFDLALLFLLYEVAGIVTNLFGGWLGARYGLRLTLIAGLALQVAALVMLSWTQTHWALALSVAYVMAAQALSGVAKDLTKMSSKSAVKRVAGEGRLFKWVALLTGSKNALKGVGFFLGGALLEGLGFQGGLWLMATLLGLVLGLVLVGLKADLGRAKAKALGGHLLAKDAAINRLSAARIFLFASRDVWFVVALPLFLTETLGWTFQAVGAFMAFWVIGYGFVQAASPRIAGSLVGARGAALAAFALTGVVAAIAAGTGFDLPQGPLVLGGLLVFGAVFAVNSAVHSYLIVHLADDDRVAMDVGFYYAANAVGRLGGTLLSGLVYGLAGLGGALWVSAGLALVAGLLGLLIREPNR